MSLQATTSQTVGPYFSIGLAPLYRSEIAGPGAQGERIRVHGRVFDGDGQPVPDALLEIWQADAAGHYHHPQDQRQPADAAFFGFGRIATDAEGRFEFGTIKPGRVPGPDGARQAPHLMLTLFMRGMLKHAVTRIYFDDEASNGEDLVLRHVPAPRRETLLARRHGGSYRWEIHMQGEHETVFFAV